MTQREIDEFLKKADELTKKACKSKKAAREYLYRLGIHTKKGKLRREYRD